MQNTQSLSDEIPTSSKASFQLSCPERLGVELPRNRQSDESRQEQTCKLQQQRLNLQEQAQQNLNKICKNSNKTKNTCSSCHFHHNCHRGLEAQLKCSKKHFNCALTKSKGSEVWRNNTNAHKTWLPTNFGSANTGSCSGNSRGGGVCGGIWSTDSKAVASSCNGFHKSHKSCASWTAKETAIGKWCMSYCKVKCTCV